YAVFVGRNNCGKSFLLKWATKQIGQNAFYVGPQRHQNFNTLNYFTPDPRRKANKWRNFSQQADNATQNVDLSTLVLQESISLLPDAKRESLAEIIAIVLGSKMELLHTVPGNSMSNQYVSVDGHNISYTSSGFMLITALATVLLDGSYDTFLVDEPELGISPEAQGVLADFLYDRNHRQRFFPHLKTLVLATHSSIFLDRRCLRNNFMVTKSGDEISVQQTGNITDFNNINFLLLGNRLESLYLPECIILVEGKCDHAYLSRLLELKFPNIQFSVINATSDSRMKEIVSLAGSLFTDLQKSPYRTRIIPILDSVHGRDIVPMFTKIGIPESNIVIWNANGIEYYYPDSILNEIYGEGTEIQIDSDNVTRNGISYKKWELCQKVVAKLEDPAISLPAELSEKLFAAIDQACDLQPIGE
ncbi:MAG: ATP-binding protein, partial [Cyanobacteria bacterium J06633_2]